MTFAEPDPIPAIELPGWSSDRSRWTVRLSGQDGAVLTLSRSARSPLSNAYPVGRDDIEAVIEGGPAPVVQAGLAVLPAAVWQADPGCRRIVVPIPATAIEYTEAAHKAGLRRVVEVDLGDDVRALYVAESPEVMAISTEVEDMPD